MKTSTFCFLLSIFLFLISLVFSSYVHAADNDLDKWNGNVSKEIREDLKKTTTTYKTLKSVDTTADKVKANYADSTVKAGTRVGVTIDALEVPYSRAEAAKEFAKRWSKKAVKGGAYGMVGLALIEKVIDGVGWVIDDGGKVIKTDSLPTVCLSSSDCVTSEYVYYSSYSAKTCGLDGTGGCYVSAKDACDGAAANLSSYGSIIAYPSSNVGFCQLARLQDTVFINRFKNPNYNSTATPTAVEVTNDEIQDAIQDAMANDAVLEKQIADSAYSLQDKNGNATSNFKDADPELNTPAQTFLNVANAALSDDANAANATINSGASASANSSSTTQNSDGTTSETDTKTETEWPAFCDWATIVCDFIEWMQQEPEIESVDLPEKSLEQQSFVENLFGTTSSCPADNTLSFNLPHGKSFSYTFKYTTLCQYLSFISWIFVIFGYWSGAMIVTKWS